jgi:hypothetical protein
LFVCLFVYLGVWVFGCLGDWVFGCSLSDLYPGSQVIVDEVAGLDLQNRQLNQQAASVNAQLQLGRERLDIIKGQIAAGDKRAVAALAIAENKAASTWQSSPEYRTAQQQAAKMPPIEAQRFIQNSWLQYKENMLPSLMGGQGGGANIPSFNDLYKATE